MHELPGATRWTSMPDLLPLRRALNQRYRDQRYRADCQDCSSSPTKSDTGVVPDLPPTRPVASRIPREHERRIDAHRPLTAVQQWLDAGARSTHRGPGGLPHGYRATTLGRWTGPDRPTRS